MLLINRIEVVMISKDLESKKFLAPSCFCFEKIFPRCFRDFQKFHEEASIFLLNALWSSVDSFSLNTISGMVMSERLLERLELFSNR